MKIINSTWYTPMALYNEKYNCIGIVKVLTEFGEEKYYIGVGQGLNEQADAEFIAMNGSPYFPNVLAKVNIKFDSRK